MTSLRNTVRAASTHTSDNPAIGTYEAALTHVGRRSPRYRAVAPAGEGAVKMFCAMVEDPNPAYWDHEVAARVFGAAVVPPALLQGLVLPLPWSPVGGGGRPDDPGAPHALAVFAVPLPGRTLINVSTEAVHHRPVRVGERLTYHDEVIDISPERTTRLGTGHFVTTAFHYEAEDGEPVATVTNVMFRFGGDAA